ncbi:hypothetical protein bsdcttw_26260 [Anaerocolumna chitinilytica]|uniref:Uncharacterized protein n=1 Tax=Anaerocolumna chitinilytica TaxID=1727145 RepID=A0A7I8DR39_9FIRM|nr:hypothetical protein bsdcttw_26260 [Anaerocolumna chitinilytica]
MEIHILEIISIADKVFKQRFIVKYPTRKTISTEFANKCGVEGLQKQIDAIAYKGKINE